VVTIQESSVIDTNTISFSTPCSRNTFAILKPYSSV
jgi:hypothetical protein